MLNVIEFFAGIGSQKKALIRQNIKHNIVGISEWDVNAIISYDATHTDDGVDYTEDMTKKEILEQLKDFTFSVDGKVPCNKERIKEKKLRQLYNANKRSKNMGDITKINELPDAHMWTYSFPCQDISISGKRKGLGEGTRSGLLYEIERLLEIKKSKNLLPQVLLLENVKNLIGKEFKPAFESWVSKLDELGYNTYWEVVNAKNCGIPQNRERVFAVSIRKDITYLDFKFPQPFDSGLRLKDFLEDNVDEKYYIHNDRVKELIEKLKENKKGQLPQFEGEPLCSSALSSREHRCSGWNETVGTLCARDYKDPKVVAVVCEERKDEGLRFFKDNVCGSLRTIDSCGDKRIIEENTNKVICLNTKDENGKQPPQQARVYDCDGVMTSLMAEQNGRFNILEEDTNKLIQAGNLEGGKWDKINESCRRYYSEDGIAPTIHTCQGGNTEPKVLEVGKLNGKNYNQNKVVLNPDGVCNTIQGQGHCGNEPKILENNNIIQLNNPSHSQQRVYDIEGISPTISAGNSGGGKEPVKHFTNNYRIRKLTPKECWRLMGFDDEDIDKCIAKGVSNSQLYKQAGNSIVVQCLELIFKNLFKPNT